MSPSIPEPSRPGEVDVNHVRLKVELRADGDTWPVQFRVPFSAEPGGLGIRRYRDRPPIIPSALAVSKQGFWILDPDKGRLCLFDPNGRLVRDYAGVQQGASDLALDEQGRPVVVNNESDFSMLRLRREKS